MSYKDTFVQYIEATNTHYFENVKKFIHPKANYWFTDKTCTSIEEVQNYFEDSWNMIKGEVYSFSRLQWLVEEENTATCIYTYHYEGYIDDRFVCGSRRATNVFLKDNDGKWKLIHEHLSK